MMTNNPNIEIDKIDKRSTDTELSYKEHVDSTQKFNIIIPIDMIELYQSEGIDLPDDVNVENSIILQSSLNNYYLRGVIENKKGLHLNVQRFKGLLEESEKAVDLFCINYANITTTVRRVDPRTYYVVKNDSLNKDNNTTIKIELQSTPFDYTLNKQ